MQRRPGFTLIELLVVIAIIAILAAMFLFARAREKAQSVVENVKQLNLAWQRMSGLRRLRPMPTVPPGGVYRYFIQATPATPVRLPRSGLKNAQVTLCRAARQTLRHYGANMVHVVKQIGPASLSQIHYPSETLLFCDNQNQAAWCPCDASDPAYTPGLNPVPHNGGVNVGFCDGHAKWMNPDGGVGSGTYAGMTGLKACLRPTARSAVTPPPTRSKSGNARRRPGLRRDDGPRRRAVLHHGPEAAEQ